MTTWLVLDKLLRDARAINTMKERQEAIRRLSLVDNSKLIRQTMSLLDLRPHRCTLWPPLKSQRLLGMRITSELLALVVISSQNLTLPSTILENQSA